MNTCSTCGTYAKTFDPTRRHDGKLEFVEHVLGTLIESRYGYENPYVSIGESNVTTGHSQMFGMCDCLRLPRSRHILICRWVQPTVCGQLPFRLKPVEFWKC